MFHSIGHQLLLGALRADDVLGVGDEALADEGGLAGGATEAVVVPVAAFEGDESGAADACRRKLVNLTTTTTTRQNVPSHSSILKNNIVKKLRFCFAKKGCVTQTGGKISDRLIRNSKE